MNYQSIIDKLRSHRGSAVFIQALATLGLSCSSAKPEAAPAAASADSASGSTDHERSEKAYTNDDWWPNRLDLRVLKQNAPKGDPMDVNFNYAEAFTKLDMKTLKEDIENLLKTSQDWWPADYGHYGGLMIRLAWHSSGTYRATDGRGGSASGTIRFAPLNSWPDNANLDKARRLLLPIKMKYGRSLSWADLMVLSGNVALESMGFKTLGFGGGREDVYEASDINWGPEVEWLADERFSEDGKKLKRPLGASQMGLIYVNPEGPGGVPDPLAAADHIRLTFARMGMNDEETIALIAGGHTLGKAHGAARASAHVGPEPEAAPLQEQGLGWKNTYKSGKGSDTITSGLEGAWTNTPVQWSHGFFKNLYEKEWVLIEGPGGAKQWAPKDGEATVPDAHEAGKRHKPMMLTTDLALKMDPSYGAISKRFYENPQEFEMAFAKAWYKLTHRDMGPHVRLHGAEVPPVQSWQDPVPEVAHKLIEEREVEKLKKDILNSGLPVSSLVRTAWASASSYRDTDRRGGANGARIRLAPQKSWPVNGAADNDKVIAALVDIQTKFNGAKPGGKKVSLADLIVLGGAAALEKAAKDAGQNILVPFTPGRTDASQDMTDVVSFQYLEPQADGFRNYLGGKTSLQAGESLVDKARSLNLSAPEMTILLAGMRALATNFDNSKHGVLSERPGVLSNDFLVNLLDMNVEWKKSESVEGLYEGRHRGSDVVKWTGTAVDLLIGSNSQLRAIAEVYAADDAKEKFVKDFVAVWSKVMMLDRFDQ